MEALGISLVTKAAAGISASELSPADVHGDVPDAARDARDAIETFGRLLRSVLVEIDRMD